MLLFPGKMLVKHSSLHPSVTMPLRVKNIEFGIRRSGLESILWILDMSFTSHGSLGKPPYCSNLTFLICEEQTLDICLASLMGYWELGEYMFSEPKCAFEWE